MSSASAKSVSNRNCDDDDRDCDRIKKRKERQSNVIEIDSQLRMSIVWKKVRSLIDDADDNTTTILFSRAVNIDLTKTIFIVFRNLEYHIYDSTDDLSREIGSYNLFNTEAEALDFMLMRNPVKSKRIIRTLSTRTSEYLKRAKCFLYTINVDHVVVGTNADADIRQISYKYVSCYVSRIKYSSLWSVTEQVDRELQDPTSSAIYANGAKTPLAWDMRR